MRTMIMSNWRCGELILIGILLLPLLLVVVGTGKLGAHGPTLSLNAYMHARRRYASAAILVHSLVDFPLRTATIAAVFAMCLALLVERPPLSRRTGSDWRAARHVVIK